VEPGVDYHFPPWLRVLGETRGTIYIPQMGDEVIFFLQGYQRVRKKIRDNTYLSEELQPGECFHFPLLFFLPLVSLILKPLTSSSVERCKVEDIQYHPAPRPGADPYCVLLLVLQRELPQDGEREFKVRYFSSDDPDFLIL
jgi:hypothetical protein